MFELVLAVYEFNRNQVVYSLMITRKTCDLSSILIFNTLYHYDPTLNWHNEVFM